MLYYRRNSKKIYPTNILSSLVTHNNFATAVYIEPITNTKYHICQFYMEQCFIRQLQENIAEIHGIINVPILQLRFIQWERNNIQYLMLDNP